MSYNVSLGEEENEIVIGEVDKLTKSAYKSVVSALEVMYGKEVVKYFQTKYPGLMPQ